MSRSQIHVYTYVLRHAWLNLLSEHITAGRINQVTFKKPPFARHLTANHDRESTRRATLSRILENTKIRSFSHELPNITRMLDRMCQRLRICAMNSRIARPARNGSHRMICTADVSSYEETAVTYHDRSANSPKTAHFTNRTRWHSQPVPTTCKSPTFAEK
jgi:hypothetical protein